jgi:hypothetical protein
MRFRNFSQNQMKEQNWWHKHLVTILNVETLNATKTFLRNELPSFQTTAKLCDISVRDLMTVTQHACYTHNLLQVFGNMTIF